MMRQVIAVVMALGIFGIGLIAFSKISSRDTNGQAANKPAGKALVKLVETFSVVNQSIQTKVPLYGRLISFEKIELFAEVSGMLLPTSPNLRAGTRFNKGDILLKIDDKEPRLSLQAQRSALLTAITQILPDMKIDFPESLEQWEAYRRNYNVESDLAALPTPKSDREKDYIALKNIYNQYYTIKSAEERLTKYTLRAPFAGELTESLINTGSYIRAGQKLATLMNISNYELEASVPLEDLKYIKLGDRVRLTSEDMEGEWSGRVARISNTIDTKTQMVKLYIQVSGNNLRENMFLTGEADATTMASVVEIPRRLLVDGNAVFGVQDSTLVKMPVQVVKLNQETALIRGVNDGTQLLKELFTGAYEGMKVSISNPQQ